MVANSSAVVNGVLTATVLDGTSPDVDALVAHETFHVFCQLRHPHWSANEGAVFAYPDDDSNVLALRRLEAAALRRAVIDSSRGWAAAAMALRQECLARIPEDAARYQRDLERHEGLAFYVQGKVTGSILCLDRLAQPARPDEIRRTAYPIGEAIAVLLDRFAPDWSAELERDDHLDLDDLLMAAVRHENPEVFSEAERAEASSRARRDVASLQEERRTRRAEFLSRSGKVVLTAPDHDPMRVVGFDPMNLHRLGDGEILHTHLLKLRRHGVELEVLDAAALTEAAGAHPLFDGIRRVTLLGLPERPERRDPATPS